MWAMSWSTAGSPRKGPGRNCLGTPRCARRISTAACRRARGASCERLAEPDRPAAPRHDLSGVHRRYADLHVRLRGFDGTRSGPRLASGGADRSLRAAAGRGGPAGDLRDVRRRMALAERVCDRYGVDTVRRADRAPADSRGADGAAISVAVSAVFTVWVAEAVRVKRLSWHIDRDPHPIRLRCCAATPD